MARSRKVTYSLRNELLTAIDRAVAEGAAPSKNAFVELALTKELRAVERQHLSRELMQAAQDPLFLRDVEEIEAAFAFADAETARMIG